MQKKMILISLLMIISAQCYAYDWLPERRKDQNPTEPAHLVVPLPYSKPGIGDGFVLMGTVSNVAQTTADLTGIVVTGDASGFIINGSEVALYSDLLFMDFFLLDINRAGINNYAFRGISETDKDDYTVLDVSLARQANIDLNLTFFQRRLNFYYSYDDYKNEVEAIRDNNGQLITTLGETYRSSGSNDSYQISVDLTDDYLDPLTGYRFDIKYQDHQATNLNEAEFYTLDYSLLAYFPMHESDTLVVNYFQSDAHVTRKGNTDADSIRAELNTNCAPTDTLCLLTEQQLVDNFISARNNGTSSSLGGDSRLRSFPQERYTGAHTAFVGFEYRWNIVEEAKPFDYFIWKDVRTGLQLAFFAETGSVAETRSALWDESRQSLGAGLRMVAASGAVYRADIATGSEGVEVIIIFDYPWE